ncbi:DUF2993 domain-containing protein [Phytohabitans rumicis]
MSAPPRRRRWGRRLLVVLIVLLVILGGLLAVADRVAASVAERTISDEIAKELVAQDIEASQPEVGIGGFPFLTQVLSGRYESISIRLRDLEGTVAGNGVRLPQLDVDARDVSAPLDAIRSGQGDVVASTVEGTATIAYASIVDLMNQPGLRLSEQDGNLAVTAPLDVLGQRITVSGTAKLTVADNQVRINFENLTSDDLPNVAGAQSAINQYARQISVNMALPELPFQLNVRSVEPLPEGLTVSASAQNVPLNQW